MDQVLSAGRREAIRPLRLRYSHVCVICKKPVVPGEMYVEAKNGQYHEDCIPQYMAGALKLLGFEAKQKEA